MLSRRLFPLLFILCFLGTSCQKETTPTPPSDPHVPYDFTAQHGMVVAAHPLAAEAGLRILKQGGNAVDAAVATALALNAAEPFASGIGGGGFMVIHLAEAKKTTLINFREKAPAKASPEMFLQDGEINNLWRQSHGLAVAVPGALAGWIHALEAYGSKTLEEVIQPAIIIAEDGYHVSATFSKINKDEYERLLLNAGENNLYLNDGFPFEPGDFFRNPELAAFFRRIASLGIKEFYQGKTAEKIVAAVQAKGGIMTLADLKAYRVQEQAPLTGTYRDFTLYTAQPPSCGGLHILQLLNICEGWPLQEWGHNSAEYIHHLSEAFRFLFADRARYLGDPVYVDIPVTELLNKTYAASIRARIQAGRTADAYPAGEFGMPPEKKGNTSHLCVVDQAGNLVALTQSINSFFGSGIIPDGTGFILNNQMADFAPDPDSPNAPGPHKRPVSNMAPLLLFLQDKPFLILGSPGGTRIFPSLSQIILNLTEFGMGMDEAIEAPRFFSYSSRGKARNLSLESRIGEDIRSILEQWGHVFTIREAYDKYFGGAQGIRLFPSKNLILGGADSRRDGAGAGY